MEFQKGEAGQLNVSNTEDSLWTDMKSKLLGLQYPEQRPTPL